MLYHHCTRAADPRIDPIHVQPILEPVYVRPILGPTVTAARDEPTVNAAAAAGSVDAAAVCAAAGLPFRLTTETRSAIEAVQFVAAHLKNEDDYAEVCDQSITLRIGGCDLRFGG